MKRSPLALASLFLVAFAACPGSQTAPPIGPTGGGDGSAISELRVAEPAPDVRLDDRAHPTKVAAKLWLDPRKEDFRGEVTIDVTLAKATRVLWLNADNLTIELAEWSAAGGAARAVTKESTSNDDFVGFDLGGEAAPGSYQLRIKYTGLDNYTDYSGLFVQEDEGHKYLYSQFEALGARRAFPSFDQPEWKTPWQLTITVPAGNEAFANTPEQKRETSGEAVTIHFAESKPLPSYLVALAVGPFSVIDIGVGGRNKTPMRVIVPKGREAQTNYAKANMAKILVTLEDYFDLAYPYAKLDSIVIPNFFGAMENPGLITYAAGILVSDDDKVTQSFRERHIGVVAHEIAHQWFGNLVTLRWWNDIWLNESFASWLAAKVVFTLHPEWGGEVAAVQTRDGAMGGDSLESARKIRQPVVSKQDISSAFDGITYGKGAAVIAMFEQWIGEDKFRAAMREYMGTHAWKTTTSDDFLASLAAVSDEKLPTAFGTFLNQTGYPVFAAELSCEKGAAPSVKLSQRRYVPTGSKADAEGQTWQVPVCLKYGTKGKTYTTCELVTDKAQTIALAETKTCPAWVHGNSNSTGYYRVSYEGDLLGRLLKAGKAISTAEKIGLVGDLAALLAAGDVEVGTTLSLLTQLVGDPNPRIIASAASIAAGVSPLVTPALHKNYERFLGKLLGKKARALGWTGTDKESLETKELRSTLVPLLAIEGSDSALLKGAEALAQKWLTDRKAIDRDMLAETLSAAAKIGDEKLYGLLYAEAIASKDQGEKAALLAALGAFTDPKLTERSLEILKTGDFDLRQVFNILQVVMSDRNRRQIGYDFVKSNYDEIAAKMPPMAHGFLVFVAVPFCDTEHKDDALAFFGERVKNADRTLAQAAEAIDLCMAQRDKQGPGLEQFLRKY